MKQALGVDGLSPEVLLCENKLLLLLLLKGQPGDPGDKGAPGPQGPRGTPVTYLNHLLGFFTALCGSDV